MKRILVSALVLASLIACNSGGDSKTDNPEKKDEPKTAAVTDDPDYKAGFDLVAKSDCFTCHKVDEVLTGPSYRDVANKYASQAPGIIPSLAEKIVKGGSGVWGQVPMLPHPAVSQADAEAMVKYILLLKK